MRALRRLFALLMLIGMGAAASAAEVSIPRSPTHWATDTTGFLAPQTVVALDARLSAYESSSGHQVLVYVAPTTGATPTEDWTVRAFARWKVGRKGLDDGLVLFVFPTDRKVRIEVGYGLEQTIPDVTAARIIRDITTKLKAGQPDAAVTSGIDEILAALAGESRPTPDSAGGKNLDGPRTVAAPVPAPVYSDSGSNGSGEAFGEAIGILIGVLVSVGIIVLIMKLPPSKSTYISSSSGGDGWGLAGMVLGGIMSGVSVVSSFSGGGGSSGGGGATGSW